MSKWRREDFLHQNMYYVSDRHSCLACVVVRYQALFFLLLLLACAHARISVMYAHDKLSDIVAEACLTEMYPKTKRLELQESDEQCIIFCVLKKFGIMNANGGFNLDIYKKRVQVANQLERVNMVRDFGGTCMENAEATQYKQDVCRKAKVFNDCTHLYRILLRK